MRTNTRSTSFDAYNMVLVLVAWMFPLLWYLPVWTVYQCHCYSLIGMSQILSGTKVGHGKEMGEGVGQRVQIIVMPDHKPESKSWSFTTRNKPESLCCSFLRSCFAPSEVATASSTKISGSVAIGGANELWGSQLATVDEGSPAVFRVDKELLIVICAATCHTSEHCLMIWSIV